MQPASFVRMSWRRPESARHGHENQHVESNISVLRLMENRSNQNII